MTDQELLSLSEEDIKLRLITPAIVEKAGWSKENIRMEFPLTDGRVIILGKSHGVQQPKRLDYLLRLNAHQMIAVVEAKSARKDLTTGIQQAIEYAVALHLPFAYASNGKAFLEHDMLTGAERQFSMDEFPTSEQLKQRAIREKNLTPEQAEVMETPYYFDRFSHEPRYYQRNAIDLTLEAVAKGQNRILLVMATGTGKTYTAIALAVRALKNKHVRRIILSRPAVEAGEKLGFLPGDMKEKIDPYLQPLYDALEDMIPPVRLREMMEQNIIQIAPLAFMRGRTLNDAVVILDEAQNTTVAQLKMFLTRMGMSTKMIVTGDMTQVDLPRNVRSGLADALEVLHGVKGIGFVQLTQKDIVRHKLVTRIVEAYRSRDAEADRKARQQSDFNL